MRLHLGALLALRDTCARVAICDTGLWNDSHSSLLRDLLLGAPLDEGACEQQAIQSRGEDYSPGGCKGLRSPA